MIEKNVGGLDRQLRFAAGVVLLAVGVTLVVAGPGAPALGVVAVAGAAGLLFNAVTQFCLMNKLFGIDTCGDSC